MKKITFLFILIFALNANAQVTDFVSGINTPNRLLASGNTLYVQGETEIYQVLDVTAPTPVATPIFSAGINQGISNFTISGNFLYVAIETYDPIAEATVNTTISKIDVNNLLAGAVPLYISAD